MKEPEGAQLPEEIRDEVWRRIGRNLLLFQHLEEMMKAILSMSRIEGPVSRVQQISEARTSEVNRKTLGMLKEQYFEEMTSKDLPARVRSEPLKEAWVRLEVTLERPAG